jgi:dipeptidyl aminopeptidase/acylaminoacyl peptidase
MGSRKKLLGVQPDSINIARFSNEMNIKLNTPPSFLVHSSDDRVVPVQNVLIYYEQLIANKVKGCELHIYPNGNHGYGLAEGKEGNVANWKNLCLAWLEKNFK